jgi:hypothetical protein
LYVKTNPTGSVKNEKYSEEKRLLKAKKQIGQGQKVDNWKLVETEAGRKRREEKN